MTQTLRKPSFSAGEDPAILADIYDEDVNIAIWQRELGNPVQQAVETVLAQTKTLQIVCTVEVTNCAEVLAKELGSTPEGDLLAQDIHALADMYCCLFDLERVAIRITKLDRAMCPRFHVDRVPVRLVTTYQGNGSQWLQNDSVDRSKLGRASVGIPDEKSGVYRLESDIQNASVGDVVLLKGESWIGNEGRGIVHRSPAVPSGQQRMVMTFDFAETENDS